MYDNMPRSFNTQYRCFSVSMLYDREDVEKGGKSMYSLKYFSTSFSICLIPTDKVN